MASISEGDSKVEVTDTGSDGLITLVTENAERMRIASDGKVGIGGDTNLLHPLAIKTANGNLEFGVDASGAFIQAYDRAGATNIPLRLITWETGLSQDIYGRIGIGVASPTNSKVEIRGSGALLRLSQDATYYGEISIDTSILQIKAPSYLRLNATTVQIGLTGPKLKDNSGVLEVRNSADNAYANVKANALIIADAGNIGSATTPGAIAIASDGKVTLTQELKVDTINEKTADAGVTIDGLLIKDGAPTFSGDLTVSKADPKLTLTDTGDSNSATMERSDTYAEAKLTNKALHKLGIDSNTVLMLHCDDDVQFEDSSGHDNDGTAHNGAAIVTNVEDPWETYEGCAKFDGTDDYLSAPDSADWIFATGDFTIDFWVKYNNINNQGGFVGQKTDGYNFIRFLRNGGNYLQFQLYIGGVNKWLCTTSSTWTPSDTSTWYHIAFVKKGTTSSDFMIFVNGVQLTTNTTGATDLTYSAPNFDGTLQIGNDTWGNYFNGWIDEFRISKGIARWISNFIPPSIPYSGASEAPDVIRTAIGIRDAATECYATCVDIGDRTNNDNEVKIHGHITDDLVIINGAKIGIGTASPAEKLHVKGNLKLTGALKDADGNSASAASLVAGRIKGWIQFNGTTTPPSWGDSYNVSGVARNDTGDYRITWDTDFADANYCVVGLANDVAVTAGGDICIKGVNAAYTDIIVYDSATHIQQNVTIICVMAIGDQ
jgi:hypothetical protein